MDLRRMVTADTFKIAVTQTTVLVKFLDCYLSRGIREVLSASAMGLVAQSCTQAGLKGQFGV